MANSLESRIVAGALLLGLAGGANLAAPVLAEAQRNKIPAPVGINTQRELTGTVIQKVSGPQTIENSDFNCGVLSYVIRTDQGEEVLSAIATCYKDGDLPESIRLNVFNINDRVHVKYSGQSRIPNFEFDVQDGKPITYRPIMIIGSYEVLKPRK